MVYSLETYAPCVDAIIELARTTPDIDILWLYGSRARGTEAPESDYDLAIAFTHYLDHPVDRRLRPELLALAWNKTLQLPLSIIDIEQVPLPLAYTVIMDNTVLWCRNDYRRMTLENTLMSKWELDYCYSKKHYA